MITLRRSLFLLALASMCLQSPASAVGRFRMPKVAGGFLGKPKQPVNPTTPFTLTQSKHMQQPASPSRFQQFTQKASDFGQYAQQKASQTWQATGGRLKEQYFSPGASGSIALERIKRPVQQAWQATGGRLKEQYFAPGASGSMALQKVKRAGQQAWQATGGRAITAGQQYLAPGASGRMALQKGINQVRTAGSRAVESAQRFGSQLKNQGQTLAAEAILSRPGQAIQRAVSKRQPTLQAPLTPQALPAPAASPTLPAGPRSTFTPEELQQQRKKLRPTPLGQQAEEASEGVYAGIY